MNFLQRLDPRRSLTLRIILINLTLILLALGSLVVWTGVRLQKNIIETAEQDLELRALIVANGLREPLQKQLAYETEYEERERIAHKDDEADDQEHRPTFVPFGDRDLKTIVDSYAEKMGARVTILGPDLTVRYSSDSLVPTHVEDRHPEITTALQGAEKHDVRLDEWTGAKRLFVAAPIGSDDTLEGLVQLSTPMDEIMAQVRSMWLLLITAALALTVLFVLASVFLGRQITRPLLNLTSAANRLAAGDLSTRLDMDSKDELGALAAAFDHMAEQISRLLAHERSFVANASHELRSPLTSIQLRAELLQMTADDEQRRSRYIQEIREESEQLGHLLQQLLDLDRTQSAPAKTTGPIAPSPCLNKVVDLMRPLAEESGLDLRADIPPGLPFVSIDAKECELVIRNLLDNAFKYTPADGSVHLQAVTSGDWVQITVRDTGIGIPQEDIPYIFDRFYRVDKARDRTGSGLGLALVKSIVEMHEGEIEVSSAEGQGTTMIVRLPRVTAG